METLRGYDNWKAGYRDAPKRCSCGHAWDDHTASKIADGTGGRIENDEHRCDFWEGCGCEGYEAAERDYE